MDIMTCAVDGCERKTDRRGWCSMHYSRWARTGGTESSRPRFANPKDSFDARTEWRGSCLIWTGAKYATGYGAIRVRGKNQAAHRFAWEQTNGPIMDGIEIDHRCFNRSCCNVAHLRQATHKQNNEHLQGAKSSNEMSGIRGVRWKRSTSRWFVAVMHNRKNHYGGSFADIKDAEDAAIKLRNQLFTHNDLDRIA